MGSITETVTGVVSIVLFYQKIKKSLVNCQKAYALGNLTLNNMGTVREQSVYIYQLKSTKKVENGQKKVL